MSKLQKNLIKSIIKKSVPKEKQAEVFAVFDKLDLDALLRDPTALSAVLSNPSKLGDYVVEEESAIVEETVIAEEDVATSDEETGE